MFQPTSIYAEGIEQPHIVNFVHYDSKEAYHAFEKDPEFEKIRHLREESIDMISYEGFLTETYPSFDNLEKRQYNIEIANYAGGSDKAYRKYEKVGEAAMKPYGYHVAYVMEVENASRQQPDFVRVTYWDDAEGHKRFESDPMHPKIERELYPDAVENMVWITANVHPVMLQPHE